MCFGLILFAESHGDSKRQIRNASEIVFAFCCQRVSADMSIVSCVFAYFIIHSFIQPYIHTCFCLIYSSFLQKIECYLTEK
mmetsp:Transcript_75555/g.120166  ORF Transcript_75555/g.120166 Transcript_75555/m.120166 type:complete len:81 (+) Transcript_75555:123-365(+)